MRLRSKLFILCMGLCLSVISATGVIIIESGACAAFQSERDVSSREAGTMKVIVTNTLLAEKYLDRMMIEGNARREERGDEEIITRTARRFFPDLRSDILLMAFYTADGRPLIANDESRLERTRPDVDRLIAKRGADIIDRRGADGHHLFLFEPIDLFEQTYFLLIVRDLGFLDARRANQYAAFAMVSAGALAVLALVTALLSKRLTRPIEDLSAAATMIARGDHTRRARVNTRDEISDLAAQFNRMADEIEKRIDLLNAQASEKQRFIDNLTHELKNPLTSIIGYANLLQTAKYDEETFYTAVEYIRGEGRRILDLTDRLFDLIMYRKQTLQCADTPLAPLFREVADLMQFKLEEKSLTLHAAVDIPSLRVDRDLIKAALINIIDNAVKASRPGGAIRLSAALRDGAACVTVEDHGKGIPAGDIAKITEPFYRVHKTRTTDEKGIGLGLAITSEIVKLHGAKLLIESEPGKGTRMRICF